MRRGKRTISRDGISNSVLFFPFPLSRNNGYGFTYEDKVELSAKTCLDYSCYSQATYTSRGRFAKKKHARAALLNKSCYGGASERERSVGGLLRANIQDCAYGGCHE